MSILSMLFFKFTFNFLKHFYNITYFNSTQQASTIVEQYLNLCSHHLIAFFSVFEHVPWVDGKSKEEILSLS